MENRDKLRITLVQTDLVWENPEQNRQNFGTQIRSLVGKSDVVLLPETFTTGFTLRAGELSETMDGPTIRWMLNLAQITKLAIGGSLLIRDEEVYYNRFVFITPNGEITSYDKRHLFSIGAESADLSAGEHRVIVHFAGWRIALYICYDIRFPVWCRNVGDTDLMLFTANWPESRNEIWRILLKARAIENQVFVAGVNRVGTDGTGITYVGDSQMINAKGEVLACTDPSQEGLFTYEIIKQELTDFREKFPVDRDADRFSIVQG